ncbi:uncharacterized protein IWZ02DRAFT_162352 [Phyllosticta citriasiana]|uniref:uncharacterized protein n=1 Tax=Phyllosticta citriasiana TaxID=595635 RepID=UPI0030FDA480
MRTSYIFSPHLVCPAMLSGAVVASTNSANLSPGLCRKSAGNSVKVRQWASGKQQARHSRQSLRMRNNLIST